METRGPHVRTTPVRCAPGPAPRPACGRRGRRAATHNRPVRTIAYEPVVSLDVTYGGYRARGSCSATFRTTPPGVDPGAHSDNKARRAALGRILDDGLGAERVIASMRRGSLPRLSDGFVSGRLDREVRRLNPADHRRWALDRFSATLGVDELHPGRDTPPLATDPLPDPPVAFAPVAGEDKDHRGGPSRTPGPGDRCPRSW